MKAKSAPTKRDYSYDLKYQSSAKQRHNRSERNRARRLIVNKLASHYGRKIAEKMVKGKDVDHIRAMKQGGKTTVGNLRLTSVHFNRARKT